MKKSGVKKYRSNSIKNSLIKKNISQGKSRSLKNYILACVVIVIVLVIVGTFLNYESSRNKEINGNAVYTAGTFAPAATQNSVVGFFNSLSVLFGAQPSAPGSPAPYPSGNPTTTPTQTPVPYPSASPTATATQTPQPAPSPYPSQYPVSNCGNGIINFPEECDEGIHNGIFPSQCSIYCTKNKHICGDGVVDPATEQCDRGDLNGKPGIGCSIDCKIINGQGYCGDGVVEKPNMYNQSEECDLGIFLNNFPGSGCSPNCTLTGNTGRCGDKIIQKPDGQGIWEECDLGDLLNGKTDGDDPTRPRSTCSKSCTIVNFYIGFCGDGVIQRPNYVQFMEQCDNGKPGKNKPGIPPNGAPGSSCSATCTIIDGKGTNSFCGDGIVQYPNGQGQNEQCDLGSLNGLPPLNGKHGSGCSIDCKIINGQGYCGDGVVEPPEQCDEGGLNSPVSGCSTKCTVQLHKGNCGDGTVESPNGNGEAEQCDLGRRNGLPGSGCSSTCKLVR